MSVDPAVVLVFAGADPTGGAGLQADLLALSALGCLPLTVVTAVTAQDTVGVRRIWPLAPEVVEEQARVALADIPAAAFKIGLLADAGVAGAVASVLRDYPATPVVMDPVLASGRGDPLAAAEVVRAMKEALFPLTTLLTPNLREARALTGEDDVDDCARTLRGFGVGNLLITGGDEDTVAVENRFYQGNKPVVSRVWHRLPHAYHGSGCTLASAAAAGLAQGLALPEAVENAQAYTWEALAAAAAAGHGQRLPDRLVRLRGRPSAGRPGLPAVDPGPAPSCARRR